MIKTDLGRILDKMTEEGYLEQRQNSNLRGWDELLEVEKAAFQAFLTAPSLPDKK